MKENKSNRGGRRQGAGRPRISAKSYTFRADDDMSAFIGKNGQIDPFATEENDPLKLG